MFEFKNFSNINDILIQEKTRNFYTVWVLHMKSWNFSKFILKARVFSEENLKLDILLVAANLNRYRIGEKFRTVFSQHSIVVNKAIKLNGKKGSVSAGCVLHNATVLFVQLSSSIASFISSKCPSLQQ